MSGIIMAVLAVAGLGTIVYVFRSQNKQPAESGSGEIYVPTPPAERMGNWLVGINGDVAGKTFFLGEKIITIGREASNGIQITDKDVSRKHCQVMPIAGGVRVIDMQSANGTYINGIEIQDQKLAPGDELRVGDSGLVYEQRIAFEQDDVLGRKNAGAGVDSTAVSGMGLPQLIRLAVKEADGDYDEAAKKLGIKVETVRKIMDAESN